MTQLYHSFINIHTLNVALYEQHLLKNYQIQKVKGAGYPGGGKHNTLEKE